MWIGVILSVITEMSPLLFGFILLHLSNCLSSKQFGLKEDVGGYPEETMYKTEKLNAIEEKVDDVLKRMERMDMSWKQEKALLEEKLEVKNVEVKELQNQAKEVQKRNESRR